MILTNADRHCYVLQESLSTANNLETFGDQNGEEISSTTMDPTIAKVLCFF